MNRSMSHRFAERDGIIFQFDPALLEFVSQKRNLDQ
jgi:hypothetical protein